MKKLLFATAIAASAAAFADSINATAFANPGEYNPNNANSYFYFAGDSDSSVVTNTSPSTTKHTANFASATDANYLALDTEGGTLWRSLGTITSSTTGEGDAITTTYDLGDARAVASTGTYLDTLVQFTVTEDEAPTVGEDDKLAIWLQAGEGTTNLMVRAGYYNAEGTFVNGGKDFVLSGVTVDPGQWYRLTVKVIDDVVNLESEFASFYKLPVFTIQIDSTYVTATEATLNSDFVSGLVQSGIVTQDTQAEFVDDKKLFVSLVQGTPGTATTLHGVGFQGTGAVDEIVWTEEDPFAGAAIDFTLTWGEGVDAVSYVLSTDLTTTNSLTSGTAVQLAPGDGTATIELIPTFESGYEFDKVTMGETELGLTFAIPGVTTNATLLAKAAAPAYPTYVDTTDAAIKAKYDAWKNTYQADTQSAWETAFLLNMDPTESVAAGTALLKIASITEVSGGWELEIVSDATTLTAETNNDGLVGNGYLAITYAADLATLTSGGTTVNLPVTVTDGKIKVTVSAPGAKFMKATLTSTPASQE